MKSETIPTFVHMLKLKYLLPILILHSLLSACKKNYDLSLEIRNNCNTGSSPVNKVLIIGYDGCRTDALIAANTPAIDSIIAQSRYSLHSDVGYHTVSVPGWSTILHGVQADKHGLTVNDFSGNHYDTYPDVNYFIKNSYPDASLAVISNWGDFLRITTQEDYAQYVSSDQEVKDKALYVLQNCTPDALILHFDDIDAAGHSSGFDPQNPKYINAIEGNDKYTAEIMQVIYQRENIYNEKWMVVLCTDHGGSGKSHGGMENVDVVRYAWTALRIPGKNPMNLGDRTNADILPSVLKFMQIPVDPAWGLDGNPVF